MLRDYALNTPVQYLKGVGPKKAKLLGSIGIKTVEDLFYYFPRRYEDRKNFTPIANLKEGEFYSIKGEVIVRGSRQSKRSRGMSIVEIVVSDNTDKIFCVWFNQRYLKDYFKIGQKLILYGKVERYAGRLQMSSPEFELIQNEEEASLQWGRIVGIYTLPQGITQRTMRKIIKDALDRYLPYLNDFLPYDIRARNNLLNLPRSLLNIHFPDDLEIQKDAHRRLSFEEFFVFQLPLLLRKSKIKEKKGLIHQVEGELVSSFIKGLPFKLTYSQLAVLAEIKQDMASPKCMQRLLEGDVGSGKTVVAAIAVLIAIQGGYQAAILVPTEILAKQHYEKIGYWLSNMGDEKRRIRLGLLTSSLDKKTKGKLYQDIKDGTVNLVIGTHALLEETVEFKNLGLVVIDEQHKFGVGQRALLPQKGKNPDILIMTATPIPRTLAITLYGDLDISVIKEMPPGRKPITTKWITSDKREWLYGFIKENILKGRQVYIVYPIIEESYNLDLLSARQMYRELKENVFKEFKVELIHGRLKESEQDRIMSSFKKGEIQVLVATTVLEVGIDVDNVSVMVIEHAERFGLSQLHQLRGRIGRGIYDSTCILVSDTNTPEGIARLSAMVEYNDGFRIAEADLKIRGPGEFFGSRQHGLCELKIANPLTQMQLLKKAREEAGRLLSIDPHLNARQNIMLKEKLLQRFPEYEKLMLVA